MSSKVLCFKINDETDLMHCFWSFSEGYFLEDTQMQTGSCKQLWNADILTITKNHLKLAYKNIISKKRRKIFFKCIQKRFNTSWRI